MFGSLGVPELLLIFVVVLIVFGPRRIPEIGQMLGKALGEFRKATDDLKNTIEREVRLEELKNIGPAVMPSFESISRIEPSPAPVPPPAPPVETAQSVEAFQSVETAQSAETAAAEPAPLPDETSTT
jgi:TatA/E family protein of Tat protein translocase